MNSWREVWIVIAFTVAIYIGCMSAAFAFDYMRLKVENQKLRTRCAVMNPNGF